MIILRLAPCFDKNRFVMNISRAHIKAAMKAYMIWVKKSGMGIKKLTRNVIKEHNIRSLWFIAFAFFT